MLAIVLGDNAESSFRQAMLMSQGDLSILFSKKLVGFMTTLALLLLFWPLISLGDRHHARGATASRGSDEPCSSR